MISTSYDENERTADVIDIASRNEIAHTNALINARRDAANKPQIHPDFDGKTCLDCGEDMPVERLAAHRIRCTHCESIIEKRNQMHA